MRVLAAVAVVVLLAAATAPRAEEGKAEGAPPAPAARHKGVSAEAKDAFTRMDKAVYCSLRAGVSDMTGTLVVVGRGDKPGENDTCFTVKARAPDELRLTSTILTDHKGLDEKAIRELKPKLAKTERTYVRMVRRFMGMFRPPSGVKYDAATEALPDGGTLLVVTYYEDGKPAEREFFTLDAAGLPSLIEFTPPDMETPPSRVTTTPDAAPAPAAAADKGSKILTWKPVWTAGEKSSRLTGYTVKSTGSTTEGVCTIWWALHAERHVFAQWAMKGGVSMRMRDLRVGGRAVDLGGVEQPPAGK